MAIEVVTEVVSRPNAAKAVDRPRVVRGVRLWPAIMLVTAYWLTVLVMNVFYSATFMQFLAMFYSPMALALGMLIWWLGFSRQPWVERFWGVGSVVLVGIAATLLGHDSMRMGMLMYALPAAVTVVVLTLVVMRFIAGEFSGGIAGAVAVLAASILGWGYFTLIRVDGVTGGLQAERSWRWSPTAEDKFLAERSSAGGAMIDGETNDGSATPQLVAASGDWPEFRGPRRDGHLLGVSLDADWTAQPPRELWRRRVGPGWSSIAVVADRGYTQEQRGEKEAVVCFDIGTGREIWSHEDEVRFSEVVSGAGPRATPTFHGGRIYSCGGSGVINCLDATTGKQVWKHDLTIVARPNEKGEKLKPPMWGFSSSPLVTQGVAIVFAGNGKQGQGLIAFDAQTGDIRWSAGEGTHSYSSPHLATIGGQNQVLIVTEQGVEAFDPATGKLLWSNDWNLKDMFRVCQPHVVGDSQVLLGTPMMEGTRLLSITRDGDAWNVKEEWTCKDLKPYFNDFVRYDGHLYGFDNDILICIDLATGKKKWKKGRYGHGQALLIGDTGRLLVISDKGEAVLLDVSPAGLVERGKFQALTGKTWNHPVIANGKLFVRNGEEMACFELSPRSDL
jgi:outer membrane protein assembly factor BamB